MIKIPNKITIWIHEPKTIDGSNSILNESFTSTQSNERSQLTQINQMHE